MTAPAATETPDAFADRMDRHFRMGPIIDDDPMGMREAMITLYEDAGLIENPETAAHIRTGGGLVDLVTEFYGELVAFCPNTFRAFCEQHVRVRGVPSFSIEGAVYRSPEGNYAVIVTTALMIFLNKIKKFILAEHDPTIVRRCNRYPVEALNPALLRAMRGEIIDNFRRGDSRGPMLLLDPERAAPIMMMLDFQESFIVAHEIGHLLSDFLLRGALTNSLHDSFGTAPHRSEYLADILGFALARRRPFGHSAISATEPQFAEIGRISSLCEFFEIVELAFPDATDTHPAPMDRAANLLATFYGDHFASHYNKRRNGEIPRYDWAGLSEQGVRPTPLAVICEVLLSNDRQFDELLDLVESEGPDALKRRAGRQPPTA